MVRYGLFLFFTCAILVTRHFKSIVYNVLLYENLLFHDINVNHYRIRNFAENQRCLTFNIFPHKEVIALRYTFHITRIISNGGTSLFKFKRFRRFLTASRFPYSFVDLSMTTYNFNTFSRGYHETTHLCIKEHVNIP